MKDWNGDGYLGDYSGLHFTKRPHRVRKALELIPPAFVVLAITVLILAALYWRPAIEIVNKAVAG